ncbi:ATPase and DNA damage recognition protein of nucleotide excision repair excinuclease UvrABC [Hyella patelloides LEGE 07179]|uniref:UvrABC system protein A n=1 Tax=Hyella patelloides LEGE 07179 TaxID=945734 RepID=A0A563VKR0_9CYAN|nr:excinuclease ABC subunit UvrA [Hyella patelloides]VEP12001.1 ATPase and DNA damage recognition protein of nucleotide excision repair excinuclease UvrABC [Hyella patelloides LEGE 07179]
MPNLSESLDTIRIRGARQHNLKDVNLDLPRNKLIVFTGVSGSGKSSLAFDTIFAEGQRRYVESLSAYARQFLGQLDKPDVDAIEGLSPAISIDQKSTSHNPRSTVGTVTEIYDYLRLLFGRAGEPHCPKCDRSIVPQTIDEMCDKVMALSDQTKFLILAPVIRGKKGTHKQLLSSLASQGFVRVRVNGEVKQLAEEITLEKNYAHNIEVVVDRLVKKPGIEERLADSLSTCLSLADGIAVIDVIPDSNNKKSTIETSRRNVSTNDEQTNEIVFSENFACPEHGAVIEELSPRLFSFNSPYGACPHCHGIGSMRTFAPELVVPDPKQPLYSAIAPWSDKDNTYYLSLLYSVGEAYGFDIQTPWHKLTKPQKDILLYGTEEPIFFYSDSRGGGEGYHRNYYGIVRMLERNYRETSSDGVKQKLEQYLINQPCEVCNGKRLKPESLAVRLGQYRINDLVSVPIRDCLNKINHFQLTQRQALIGELALKEIKARLQFLLDVGLDYLTLERAAMTLSGGEAQRIRLATQIGAGLTGVLYVLDEPSIGLHQRDNDRLLTTLQKLRDLGNTLIVVEHDEDTIRCADHIVDIGPHAGVHGGEIVVEGSFKKLLAAKKSLTGAYLSHKKVITTPTERREGKQVCLSLQDCHQNNLKHIDVDIPLGKFVAITGVSGSGKSTLINELLHPALQHHLTKKKPFPTKLGTIKGLQAIDKVIIIDQSPIGRTPRSNPVTYTGVFDAIRAIFAETIEAKARGYKAGRFSFNVKGGRCEACSGQGVNVIEMNFLPNVYVQCDVCKGARYNRETLQVKYKGYSIADVLNMTVEEALEIFQNIPRAQKKLQTLVDVGLGYIKLGQPAPTLSGGEAQRVKLASELSRRATGKTLYLIDEPTTGLSFYDVHHLLNVLQRLVDKGNSLVVIEHNLDVIRCSDWIIDLGPEGGDKGGEVIATGTPEEVAENKSSYTGKYLKQVLQRYNN